MIKHYKFECYDEETKTEVKVEFSTDNDAWCGHDGPMWQFFNFLKGCGYVFDMEAMIGVAGVTGYPEDFHPALD